jgi:hypothetical protein
MCRIVTVTLGNSVDVVIRVASDKNGLPSMNHKLNNIFFFKGTSFPGFLEK